VCRITREKLTVLEKPETVIVCRIFKDLNLNLNLNLRLDLNLKLLSEPGPEAAIRTWT
jgi:hypothetical protein